MSPVVISTIKCNRYLKLLLLLIAPLINALIIPQNNSYTSILLYLICKHSTLGPVALRCHVYKPYSCVTYSITLLIFLYMQTSPKTSQGLVNSTEQLGKLLGETLNSDINEAIKTKENISKYSNIA